MGDFQLTKKEKAKLKRKWKSFDSNLTKNYERKKESDGKVIGVFDIKIRLLFFITNSRICQGVNIDGRNLIHGLGSTFH